MRIRCEHESDFDDIYSLVKTAFETAQHPADGDEQDWILKLRAGTGYIPALALVAESDGKLIGHIMLTKTYIKTGSGQIEALLLSPIAVLAGYRRNGVGGALITESLSKAKAAGYKAVFLCGDPDYYSRFGFFPVNNYSITYDMEIPGEFVLACELQSGWLRNIKGKISII